MSQSDANGQTGDEATGGPAQELAETGREYVPEPPGAVRRGIDSGAAAAVGAGAALFVGLRALRRGDRRSAFTRLLVGGALATVAIAQRRSAGDRGQDRSGVAETDVVDTAPDVEGVGTEGETEAPPRATGEEASEVVDTSPGVEEAATEDETEEGQQRATGEEASEVVDTAPDLEDVGSDSDAESDSEEAARDEAGISREDSFERLGGAAFDEQSGRVPAPQEAFNLGLLSSGAEVFWGVDEAGDFVVVTLEYDILDDADAFRYVASSEIDDDDRGVRIPDTVQNHWDDVADGGTAVTSGTGIVFVTSDDLREDDLLLVVPEQWIDELFEESGASEE